MAKDKAKKKDDAAADEKEEAVKKPAAETTEEGAEGEGDGSAKKSKKKLIIIGAAIVVLIIAIGAGLYFSGLVGGHSAKTEGEEGKDSKTAEKPVYYTLPEFLINLSTGNKSSSFLKTTVILEVSKEEDVPLIEANLPRLVDAINTYLRELRASDLSGSAGIQRLREELLLRSNKALTPVKINDVLFKEIVVQ